MWERMGISNSLPLNTRFECAKYFGKEINHSISSKMEQGHGGNVRIHHLSTIQYVPTGKSRFPKLDECAHFHYDVLELAPFQVCVYKEELKPLSSEDNESKWWYVSITSQGKSWILRRSYENFRVLDQQLHQCIYDRKFSRLKELPRENDIEKENSEEIIQQLLSEYLSRFSEIADNQINCGPVLNWLELDNRGRRLLVPDNDNCPINTPAVAAAYSIKQYTAQAGDEISFEVGDIISVIDMPPPDESVWWRGKHGFQVGFFPGECVAVIGDKVPHNLHIPLFPCTSLRQEPSKPILRKHGKLIAFFRSFILSRPSRRRLKQSGILRERVFGCDLGEHLLNSGHEIPLVLKYCAEFIESCGIVDGIYRLSGVTSNIQKLRNTFDEDRVPALYEDEVILQDIHSVASLLKMYFRELPNPLCTYQLYHAFVSAIQSNQDERCRLSNMRSVVRKLPPPHYRTLEYLIQHLAKVAKYGSKTGMTSRNLAIVWAPNLLRCKQLEVGSVAALQGIGVQAVVTEFLIGYVDVIFCDHFAHTKSTKTVIDKEGRPKSLIVSTPTKLLSLEEARARVLILSKEPHDKYFDVGGGPSNLPAEHHTVLELPSSFRKKRSYKISPLKWKSLFIKSLYKSSLSSSKRKSSGSSCSNVLQDKDTVQKSPAPLRSVKSAESLIHGSVNDTNLANATVVSCDKNNVAPYSTAVLQKIYGHNRSLSHDSYFDDLGDICSCRKYHLLEEGSRNLTSSSLDFSDVHFNFSLEESEMQIFSEDETLVSTPFDSRSQTSSKGNLISSNICDESFLRRKHQAALYDRWKFFGLEKQLTNSTSNLQYIDSQSSDDIESQILELDDQTSSADQSPVTDVPYTQPFRESASFHQPKMTSPSIADSSGLTTPDTSDLLYFPLLDNESNSSSTTATPDYDNLLSSQHISSVIYHPFHKFECVLPSVLDVSSHEERDSGSPKGLEKLESCYENQKFESCYENIPNPFVLSQMYNKINNKHQNSCDNFINVTKVVESGTSSCGIQSESKDLLRDNLEYISQNLKSSITQEEPSTCDLINDRVTNECREIIPMKEKHSTYQNERTIVTKPEKSIGQLRYIENEKTCGDLLTFTEQNKSNVAEETLDSCHEQEARKHDSDYIIREMESNFLGDEFYFTSPFDVELSRNHPCVHEPDTSSVNTEALQHDLVNKLEVPCCSFIHEYGFRCSYYKACCSYPTIETVHNTVSNEIDSDCHLLSSKVHGNLIFDERKLSSSFHRSNSPRLEKYLVSDEKSSITPCVEGDNLKNSKINIPTDMPLLSEPAVKNINSFIDFNDAERRERIDRYKNERRLVLRKKYLSETCKSNQIK